MFESYVLVFEFVRFSLNENLKTQKLKNSILTARNSKTYKLKNL